VTLYSNSGGGLWTLILKPGVRDNIWQCLMALSCSTSRCSVWACLVDWSPSSSSTTIRLEVHVVVGCCVSNAVMVMTTPISAAIGNYFARRVSNASVSRPIGMVEPACLLHTYGTAGIDERTSGVEALLDVVVVVVQLGARHGLSMHAESCTTVLPPCGVGSMPCVTQNKQEDGVWLMREWQQSNEINYSL
jgi:hypothetical protein